MLALSDFYILSSFIESEAERFLPFPATIYFAGPDTDGSLQPLQAGAINKNKVQSYEPSSPVLNPYMSEDKIVIPLTLPSKEHVALILTDVDPEILKKMSPRWLQNTGEDLLSALEAACFQFKDTDLELYNSHAAKSFLQHNTYDESVFFLLINTVFYRRSAAWNLQKLRAIADLLQVLSRAPCFTFGYGVFGIVLPLKNREQALRQTRYLQQQLRREGLHKVQIGFIQLHPSRSKEENDLFENIWQALAVAEQRGPFGFCDFETLQDRSARPFTVDNPLLLARLNQRWRKLSRFSLIAISRQPSTSELPAHPESTGSVTLPRYLGEHIGEDDNLTFALIPDIDPEETRSRVDSIREKYQEFYGDALSLTIGVASWPCLDFTKNQMPGNCLKALLHGSYLGSGTTVFFDHISLNISGDIFFDEGDYRAAILEYRRGLRLYSNDINLMNSLGVALIECGQKRQAAECFQNVLKKDSTNYMALVNSGHVQQTLGRKDLALQSFEQAYQVFETTNFAPQDLLLPLGKLYAEYGAHEKALTVLEQWRSCPGSENEYLLFRLLGQSYLENGRYEEAKSACQKALQLFPHDSISLSTLGLLYVESDEGDDLGLGLCQKALELDNQNPDHWYRLARAFFYLTKATEAISAVKRCLQLQRHHMEGRLLLSRIYLSTEKNRLAEQSAKKVLKAATATASQKQRAECILTELGSGAVKPTDRN